MTLTLDPELRSTSSGQDVCAVRLAVPRRRAGDGEDRGAEDRGAVYVDVIGFGGLAKSVATNHRFPVKPLEKAH